MGGEESSKTGVRVCRGSLTVFPAIWNSGRSLGESGGDRGEGVNDSGAVHSSRIELDYLGVEKKPRSRSLFKLRKRREKKNNGHRPDQTHGRRQGGLMTRRSTRRPGDRFKRQIIRKEGRVAERKAILTKFEGKTALFLSRRRGSVVGVEM